MLSLTSLFGDEAPILRERDFQILLLAAVLPVLGTALVSPVLDSLIDPLGATSANIGLMISAISAPAIVMIPLIGVLADRYGRRRVLIVSILLFGLAGSAIAFTTDFRVVLALRFLQGVGYAGINPVIITSVGDLYTDEKEASGEGIRFMMSGLSGAVFPLFASLLVVLAWQYPFLMYAMAFPVAVGVYIWFEEPTEQSSAAETDGGGAPSYVRALLGLSRQRRVLAMVLARWLLPVIYIGFLTYNSLIVVRLMDGTPVQAGILVAVLYLVFAVSASQAGRITSVFGSRYYPLVAANVGLAVGFVTVLFAPGLATATAGTTVIGVGFGIMGSLYRSVITGFAPADLRAGLVSLSEAGGRFSSTLTPLVMGGVISLASPSLGFASALRFAGLGAVVVASGGSIFCLYVARCSPPISIDRPESPGT